MDTEVVGDNALIRWTERVSRFCLSVVTQKTKYVASKIIEEANEPDGCHSMFLLKAYQSLFNSVPSSSLPRGGSLTSCLGRSWLDVENGNAPVFSILQSNTVVLVAMCNVTIGIITKFVLDVDVNITPIQIY